MKKNFPVGNWWPIPTLKPSSGKSFRSDYDNSNTPRLSKQGIGGDTNGTDAFQMLVNGVSASIIENGQVVPTKTFSFRCTGGTVKFSGKEFNPESLPVFTVENYGPQLVDFSVGDENEFWICYCEIKFTRDPDQNKVDRRLIAIETAEIKFVRTNEVTDAMERWLGDFENTAFRFKIGYLCASRQQSQNWVFAQQLQVGNFVYNTEIRGISLQVIVEENSVNVVKTLNLNGDLEDAAP